MNMLDQEDAQTDHDHPGLARFVDAQDRVYESVLTELRTGRKQSHWMWFVFPQMRGLGHSTMATHFGIASADEAKRYLAHPLLDKRLLECTELVLSHRESTLSQIFGSPDDLKFRSCMTLFARIAPEERCFREAINHFCRGQEDKATVGLLGNVAR